MMRPDINIAIAYSGKHQTKVAEVLRNKLHAYIENGYPVSVSLVREKIDEIGVNYATRQDGQDQAVRIAKAMENYFSDFDCAIFLFDTNGEALPTNGEVSPLLSSNLIYEYGLASSHFINREIDTLNNTTMAKKSPINDKKIFCFSPTEINVNTLRYIRGIDLIKYDTDFGKYGVDIDNQTEYIINHFIHELIVLKAGFYGLPKVLPPLVFQYGEYTLQSPLNIRDLMEQTPKNEYWPDLRKLQPGGVRVALDTDSSALNNAFNEEYNRFEKVAHPSSEYVMARRIMYIVDRAVFIMYLREENTWREKVRNLKVEREIIIRRGDGKIRSDFYWLILDGLCSVFDYQSCARLKTLYEDDNLERILRSLQPVVDNGCDGGNKMIYCLFTDYMALSYHKLAMRELKDILGYDFCLDKFDHIEKLRDYIKSHQKSENIKSIIKHLLKAISLLDSVVETANGIQKIESNGVYIWQSYALYNQARCEFMLHLLDVFTQDCNSDSPETVVLLNTYRERFNQWDTHLLSSVHSRRNDYQQFKEIPLFPQILRFNFKAEFYHAEFEYELACLVDKYFNSANAVKSNDKYNFEHKKQGFKKWKDDNLTITDVLSVDGKVSRIDALNPIVAEKDIHIVFDTIVEKLNLSSRKAEELRQSLYNITPTVKKALLTEDSVSYSEAKHRIDSVKKSNKNFNINLDIVGTINALGNVGIFIANMLSNNT